MEKYLVPDQVGEGDITEQWQRFKKEFALFLTALGKDKADSAVKLAMFLRVVGPRINDMHCAKTLLYDSVFYSVYLNIHLKYTHQRIEPYTQVRIFKYNRSRDICGCLANR